MLGNFCLSSCSNTCFCMNISELEDELETKSLISSSESDHKLRLKDVVAGKQTLAFQLKPQVISPSLMFGIIILYSFYESISYIVSMS